MASQVIYNLFPTSKSIKRQTQTQDVSHTDPYKSSNIYKVSWQKKKYSEYDIPN